MQHGTNKSPDAADRRSRILGRQRLELGRNTGQLGVAQRQQNVVRLVCWRLQNWTRFVIGRVDESGAHRRFRLLQQFPAQFQHCGTNTVHTRLDQSCPFNDRVDAVVVVPRGSCGKEVEKAYDIV